MMCCVQMSSHCCNPVTLVNTIVKYPGDGFDQYWTLIASLSYLLKTVWKIILLSSSFIVLSEISKDCVTSQWREPVDFGSPRAIQIKMMGYCRKLKKKGRRNV